MKKETTIQLSREAVKKLSNLKVHPRQSYEEIISQLIKKDKKLDFFKFVKHNSSTTIQLSRGIVEKLTNLKVHPRQSYEEIIQALLA